MSDKEPDFDQLMPPVHMNALDRVEWNTLGQSLQEAFDDGQREAETQQADRATDPEGKNPTTDESGSGPDRTLGPADAQRTEANASRENLRRRAAEIILNDGDTVD